MYIYTLVCVCAWSVHQGPNIQPPTRSVNLLLVEILRGSARQLELVLGRARLGHLGFYDEPLNPS